MITISNIREANPELFEKIVKAIDSKEEITSKSNKEIDSLISRKIIEDPKIMNLVVKSFAS